MLWYGGNAHEHQDSRARGTVAPCSRRTCGTPRHLRERSCSGEEARAAIQRKRNGELLPHDVIERKAAEANARAAALES
jgi:hypothetical protein